MWLGLHLSQQALAVLLNIFVNEYCQISSGVVVVVGRLVTVYEFPKAISKAIVIVFLAPMSLIVGYLFTDFVFDADLRISNKRHIARVEAASLVIQATHPTSWDCCFSS